MEILSDEFSSFLKCAQSCGLRYLIIGGYAVNYYGYVRNTDDLDVWIAPTNENKTAFINTLRCMNYPQVDVEALSQADFTGYFMVRIGDATNRIDVLTVIHRNVNFDEAENNRQVFEIEPGIVMYMVPYETLKDIKLRSDRQKDWYDIHMLEKLRNKGN